MDENYLDVNSNHLKYKTTLFETILYNNLVVFLCTYPFICCVLETYKRTHNSFLRQEII